MSERLTDQQLQILWEQWQPAAIELLALRARVAKLEAALKEARPYVQGVYDAAKYGDGAYIPKLVLDAIDDALKDAPR